MARARAESKEAVVGGRVPWGLGALVIIAGAVLMSLEMVGSRLLAPHFGNSVFVWGSLISVVMAALAGGYYVGGRLADRLPSWTLLGSLCVGAALLIFLVPVIGHPVGRTLTGLGLGEQSGPLVAATILLLPPSFLLGMVTPFAVRLAATSVETIGREAGTLYALSTLGSILGTLLTTFVLIPRFGVILILKGLGLAMLALPVLLALDRKRGMPLGRAALVAVVGLVLPSSPAAQLSRAEKLVAAFETPYHGLQIVDYDGGRVRALKFDRFVESSILSEPPYATGSEYTNYFHLAFVLRPKMHRVLFIGAGGGIGPRTFREMDPDLQVDVVDIDRKVLEIARDYFHMPEGDGLRTVARDGRMFLRDAEPGYDAIVLDAFTIGGRIPFHLATREAFELCRDKLAPGGVFVMNINSAVDGSNAGIFRSISATLQQVFPAVQAFAHEWRFDPDPERSRNILFFATQDGQAPSREEWIARARRYPARSSVTTEMEEAMAADLLPDVDVSTATVFTDDHAPIDTMSF
jgi:spermidine synthase